MRALALQQNLEVNPRLGALSLRANASGIPLTQVGLPTSASGRLALQPLEESVHRKLSTHGGQGKFGHGRVGAGGAASLQLCNSRAPLHAGYRGAQRGGELHAADLGAAFEFEMGGERLLWRGGYFDGDTTLPIP